MGHDKGVKDVRLNSLRKQSKEVREQGYNFLRHIE